MSHEFDTGYTLPQRRKLREAIALRLRDELEIASHPLAQGDRYLKAIVELAAPFEPGDGDLEEMMREAVAGRSPIVAIALGDRSFTASNSDERNWRGSVVVHVYVISSHRGGLLARLRGGDIAGDMDQTLDPGLETAMEHVFERLSGFVPPECRASELRPRNESFPYVGDEFTVAEIVFDVDLQTEINLARRRVRVATDVLATHDHDASHELEALSELEASS